jgi:hypothetical protein
MLNAASPRQAIGNQQGIEKSLGQKLNLEVVGVSLD